MLTFGPAQSPIAIITDYPEYSGNPDLRSLGIHNATSTLASLGIIPESCFIASLLKAPPPLVDGKPDIDEYLSSRKTCPGSGWGKINNTWVHPLLIEGQRALDVKLAEVQPRLVISLGKAPLVLYWGQDSIGSWRGSRLRPQAYPFTLLPTFHPRVLKTQPDQAFILKNDLTRAYNIYTGKQLPRAYEFQIQPDFDTVISRLLELLEKATASPEPLYLSGDLETRAGNIACFGIAWSATQALCIPHLVVGQEDGFYWPIEQESLIVELYGKLFHHRNIIWIGQNFAYDCQYFHRHWGIIPVNVRDTMIGHHSLHSNIRKGLDFLSSIYAHDHVYWKDEIKEWDPKIGERQYWEYNCKDACITYEIWFELMKDRTRD